MKLPMRIREFNYVAPVVSILLILYFIFSPTSVLLAQIRGDEGAIIPDADVQKAYENLEQSLLDKQTDNKTAPPVLDPSKTDIPGCGIADWLSATFTCAAYAITGIVAWFLGVTILPLAAAFLEHAVNINIFHNLAATPFVIVGWSITRDVANIFFIFFVLWMALATIFQFENYSAKRLLPKLIVVALLVNFSLPIGVFVIDVSNSIARVFYKAAKEQGTLTGRIMTIGAVHTAYLSVNPNKAADDALAAAELKNLCSGESLKKWSEQDGTVFRDTTLVEVGKTLFSAVFGSGTDYRTKLPTDKLIQLCTRYYQTNPLSSDKDKDTYLKGKILEGALVAKFWQIVISLVASFVFFAGGLFFLIRIISLAMLLVFGPLAFLFMILPATQSHWNDWWNKLTQWSFFAPAFMFMLMLSLRASSELLDVTLTKTKTQFELYDTIGLGLQFFMVTGLLIGSLMVANKMGIYGASTVTGWGRGATGYLKKHAKAASFRGAARMGGRFAEGALKSPVAQYMASLPGARALLRPIELAAGAKRGVEEDRAKLLSRAMATAPAEYAAARFRGERATVQANYLRSAGEKDIQKLEKGMPEEAMGTIIGQLKTIAPELGKKIGGSFKNVDLRIAATKGVTMGTPEFDEARKEYMQERTPYELGQLLTPENLQKEWVQKHLLQNAGEKEMNAINQTGEQFRALAQILERWADNRMTDPTSAVGTKINAILNREIAAGTSPEEAKRIAITSNRAEIIREEGGNQNLVTWISGTPMGAMFQRGKFMGGKGDSAERLLAQFIAGQTQAQSGGQQTPGSSVNP
ncbi:MAG: hypothetical protein Q7R73_04265 [bacterium]|nr:hypothetical protein [bacterium]